MRRSHARSRRPLAGDAGDTHTNTATVTATDGDPGSTPVTDSDDATVTFTDEVPEIVVTKSANPTSVPESGGLVVYTVDIENPSLESVTVTDLVDNRFGDLLGGDAGLTGGATATSCNDALPVTIAAGATFACTIDATLFGHEGVAHTNTVTVTATDGDPGSTTCHQCRRSNGHLHGCGADGVVGEVGESDDAGGAGWRFRVHPRRDEYVVRVGDDHGVDRYPVGGTSHRTASTWSVRRWRLLRRRRVPIRCRTPMPGRIDNTASVTVADDEGTHCNCL